MRRVDKALELARQIFALRERLAELEARFAKLINGPRKRKTKKTGASTVARGDEVEMASAELSKDEERRAFVLEEFASLSAAYIDEISRDHFRSQRFDPATTPAVVAKEIGPPRLSTTWEAQRLVSLSPRRRHVREVLKTIERRRGAGNYADATKVERAIELREGGESLRAIARETGLNRSTVLLYTPTIGRSVAARLMHARRRGQAS